VCVCVPVCVHACGQPVSQSCYSMPWLSVSHVFCLFVLQSAFTNVSILGKWTTSHNKVQAGFQVAWNNLKCRGVKGRLCTGVLKHTDILLFGFVILLRVESTGQA
jgi:hypothetical protein